jgi:arabinosyltransferase B/arabinosyltransferase C
LAVVWILCRWTFSRIVSDSSTPDRIALWTLGAVFAAGAVSWGMTLRPEPVVAVLVTGVLACVFRFRDKPSPTPLAVAMGLCALAITAHPAGLVSIAPLVVVSPSLVRWARKELHTCSALVLASGALLLVLATVGADLGTRLADSRTFRSYGDANEPWWNEVRRYRTLFTPEYSMPVRRAVVAVMLLAVLAWLIQRGRQGRVIGIPGASVGLSLILLVPSPSKWTFHFGALLGLTAIAMASETARLRGSASRLRGGEASLVLLIFGALGATAVGWWPRSPWNALDLRTLDWDFGL